MSHESSISTRPVLFIPLMMFALLGCAGLSSGERVLLVSGVPVQVSGPEETFGSVEEAAIGAFAHARSYRSRQQDEQLHVGAIIQVDDHYRWTEADSARSKVQASWRPKARIRFVANQVASYIVHPRTGERGLDRLHEKLSASEKRLVDERDPQHRPLFVLTPSGRVVSYRHGSAEVEVSSVRSGRSIGSSLASNESGDASTSDRSAKSAFDTTVLASGAN